MLINWHGKVDTWRDEINMLLDMLWDVVLFTGRKHVAAAVCIFVIFGMQQILQLVGSRVESQPALIARVGNFTDARL